MDSLIHIILRYFLSLPFPDKCIGCREKGESFCKKCADGAKRVENKAGSVLFLDKLYYWGDYENPALRKALRSYKYHGMKNLAEPFSQMLSELLKPELPDFSDKALIVPIPAHKARISLRGYNQAELLAQKLSQKTNLPFNPEILVKIKNTPSQTSLSGLERMLNIKNSFSVKTHEYIKNKKIILVDDIITTGATLSEAARVLKEAGALMVAGLVVAR